MDAGARHEGPRLRLAGRTIPIALAIAAVIFVRAAASPIDPKLPPVDPAPLADFYATLRVSGDSIPDIPESLRDARRRLSLLTEQLPESLPLRSPANTVLIVHRKNPKYRDTIERLLWRRLDPALGNVTEVTELPATFDRIATELRPLCGAGADTVRTSLAWIYDKDYPSFLASPWKDHERALRSWNDSVMDAIRPHEGALLGELSRLLGVPLADSSQVQILLIASGMPSAFSTPIKSDGRARVVVSAMSASTREGALDLLCSYIQACEAVAPEGAQTMERLISSGLHQSPPSRPAYDLHRSLLRYAVSLELQRVCGWEGFLVQPSDSLLAASYRKNWDTYVAGGIPLPTACAAIVSQVSTGGR